VKNESFQKYIIKNNRPKSQNSPNLVTLIPSNLRKTGKNAQRFVMLSINQQLRLRSGLPDFS
jgi:hypothetical protein